MKHAFAILSILCCLAGCNTGRKTSTASVQKDETQLEASSDDDRWYTSVKGHVNPDSIENNETREMPIKIWWDPMNKGGTVELAHAYKEKDGESGSYVDINTGEPLEQPYDDYGEYMWYLQIKSEDKVVEPLFLHYYFDPHFVYEGDLDQDGVPDFGILLTRQSNCCSYALLTIKDGHWTLLAEPFPVTYNLRASGKELAKRGDRKGEIKITYSDFSTDDSTCMESPVSDSVIVSQRIDIHDFM